MKIFLALLGITGCLLGQSDHCGDEYTRNMTRVKSGLYRIDGDPIVGSQQLRLQITGDDVIVTTDDGRSAQYRGR